MNPFSGEPQGLFDGSVPIWWLALGAALAWAWRNGPRSARQLGVVLVITIAASVVAVARTTGPLLEYRLRFVAVLGMLTAAFVAWVLWNSIAHRIWFPARSLAVAAIITAVGLSTYNVAIAAGTDPPHPEQGRVAAELARQLVRNLSRGSGVVVLNVRSVEAGPLITGIMLELEGHGIPVAMHDTPDDRLRFGAHRILRNQPIRAEIRVAVNDEIEKVGARPCTREIAYWGQRSRHDREQAQAAVDGIKQSVANGSLRPREGYRRLATLSPDLSAAAIFLVPFAKSGTWNQNGGPAREGC